MRRLPACCMSPCKRRTGQRRAGRLTLNVLLSFAQFEREVTGERIRDKIATSKKKGMWMGGLPPVGYIAKERTLIPDEEQARRVREIFRLYLEHNCVHKLKHELDRRCWRTPTRNIKRSEATGNRPYTRGHLYRILTNPIYLGKIAHKDQIYDGNHPAIIYPELWQAVQDRLQENRQGNRLRARAAHPSLLVGKVFDERGGRLTPSHARKGTQRYRYYVGQGDSPDAMRIPAYALERTVIDHLSDWLRNESNLLTILPGRDAKSMRQVIKLAKAQAERISTSSREHVDRWIERIVIHPDRIEIRANLDPLNMPDEDGQGNYRHTTSIEVPMRIKRCGMAVKLIVNAETRANSEPDTKLVTLIAKGQAWLNLLLSGRRNSIKAIADEAQVTGSYVTRLIKLALLAPDIMESIAKGDQPPELTSHQLIREVPLPDQWQAQRKLLGFS
jgi:site-specific DNA recombinase